VGRPFDDIKSNLQLTILDGQIAEVIETNTMHESEVQDRDGRWYRMQIRPYTNIDNKIDGATFSLVDIDALKHHVSEAERAKAEAEQANRAKDDFLGVLSHEIRTPLSSMLLQAQSLLRGNLEAAKVKRAAEVIERGTKLQVKLIDDLLDVSRIVTGKLKIDFQAVDLCAVIKAALEGVSAPAQRKALKLKVVLDETIGTVFGDATRLQQLVANLLTNAVKFTPDNGDVTLVLDSADGQARLRVSDSGTGIEPAFLPYVFNRFAQEDGSTVRRHGGLGLGLAIVRHLVEAHGGTIQAESQGRGKGAAFSVTLPLMRGYADEAASALEPASRASTSKPAVNIASYKHSLNNLRILIVDDDLGTRDAIVDMLSETGAQVRVAESAPEAITVVENFQPDVLLCDIAMPGEDGYSFIRRVRATDPARGGNIPALAFTALAGEENRRRALSAGFQMYVAKPVEMDSLMQAVVDLSHMRAERWTPRTP
jgi:two-component system CheB/CheR fusion protein